MYHLILTACLLGPPHCAPILLPRGEAETRAECEAGAGRIGRDWIAGRADLAARGTECVATGDLPALDLRQVAPGVFAYLGQPVQLEQSPDGRIANLGVVIGADSVAVIDAGVSRAQGQQLYAAIRRLTDLPVGHVILTHMHPDHVLGTQVFAEAGAQVVGHHALRPSLEMRAAGYLDGMARLYGAGAMLGTEIALPDLEVRERMDLDLGGRVLSLTAAPTAHTDNDLTVFDHATGTLFGGDLIFRELTPIVDGSLRGWLDWLADAPRPAPRIVVPGHGAVAGSWDEAVAAQRRFLDALAAAVRAELEAGVPMSQAVPDIGRAMEGQAEGWAAFPESVARDATAAYKELEWE